MKTILAEFKLCLQSIPMAWHFAWGDTKARYRRSMLGPFWIVLTTAIGVAGLGVLWSKLLKVDQTTLIPSLTVGLVVWQMITGCITESPVVLLRNAPLIRNIRTSFIFFPMHMVLRQLINFMHNALVILVVLCIFPPAHVGWTQALSLVGIFLVLANMLWIALLLGMIGARFRDIEPLINSIMPMLFFISPVLYRPENAAIDSAIIWANPFTYLITVIRDPIQGLVPEWSTYMIVLAMLVGGWTLSLWLLTHRRGRIAFWV